MAPMIEPEPDQSTFTRFRRAAGYRFFSCFAICFISFRFLRLLCALLPVFVSTEVKLLSAPCHNPFLGTLRSGARLPTASTGRPASNFC